MLHLVQRGGPERAATPPNPLLAVPDVTSARPSTASVPKSYRSMRHYNCLCAFVNRFASETYLRVA